MPLTDKDWLYIGARCENADGHVLWTMHCDKDGYAKGWIGGKGSVISRAILEEKLGRKMMPEMDACHIVGCRYRNCINPDHLYEGTKKQNQADRVIDGTASRGESHSLAKLTDEQVRAIRASSAPPCELVSLYGVSSQQIWRIRKGHSWKHLD